MYKFSVLLSLYYKESPIHLRNSLDSVFNQTLQTNEIVIVKDGPLPDSLNNVIDEYSQKFPIIKIVILTHNQGLGRALNEGLKYCTYNYIARMDTDDISKSDRFEKQIAIFKKNHEIDVVGAWVDEFVGEISNIKSIRKLPETHDKIISFSKKRNPINHPVVMFKKQSVINAGGFKHFPLFEDYYLWVRMLLHGSKFYNIQESLLYFRISTDMFKRRGGWKYILNEFNFQYELRRLGFISNITFLKNISIRFVTRIMPNKMRSYLYKIFLRE